MTLFTVWRQFDPAWEDHDFEMMQVRAIATAWMTPGYRWLRSYGFTKDGVAQGFCVYEGPAAHDLAVQQRMCWVPVTEVRVAEERIGGGPPAAPDEAPADTKFYLVERSFAPDATADVVAEINRLLALGNPAISWVRSYWDAHRSSSRCIFTAESGAALRLAILPSGATVERLEQVETNHPANWAETYDRMGLPRHWEEKSEERDADLRYLART